jgi:putative membrane protein
MQRNYDSHERGRFPTTIIAIAVAIIAAIVIIAVVFAYFSSRNSYYGNGYYGGMMGGFGGFGMLFMIPIGLIVLVIIGYVIWRGCGWGGGCGGDHYGHYASDEERETAMEILRRRYAKGEISKEQFEQMKKDIVG